MGVLKQVAFTSIYDCEQLCLKDKSCVGASITEFNRTPAYCVLAKSGSRGGRCRQFGATKDCMKSSPLKPCSDAWKRCGYCDEKENEKEEKKDDNKDVEWKEIDGVKLVGKVIKKKLTLEKAKQVCASCGGISCKGKKCMVVGDIKKEKKKSGFTAYKPEE